MKRTELVHQISDNVLTSFFPQLELRLKNLIADCIVTEIEKSDFILTKEDGMPMGILKFKLPEEREEFELTQQAGALHCVLSELDNWLRAKTKYEDIDNVTVEEVRQKIRELKEEYEVTAQ